MSNKTVAVTGASGMLGPYLCRALLASGARVRGVVRNLDKARFLEREGITLAKADLMQRDALADAFRGCDAVISNAALYRVFFTVGGLIFGLEKPNPLPGRFGFHEIWHCFVVAGAASHFAFMYLDL